MSINLSKLSAALRRAKRVKGVPPDLRLEKAWVRYAVNFMTDIQRDLWREIEPTLKAILPEKPSGSTIDTALETAFANAERRFADLSSLKERADAIFAQVDSKNRDRFRALLKQHIGVDFNDATVSPQTQSAIKQHVDDTVDLIKTVGQDHFAEFKETIYRGISEGTDFHSLRALVVEAGGKDFPGWKVERIAVDQYLKLHGKVTQMRQQSVGITHYFWRTSGDARVRKEHQANEGKRFAWSDPPATGHPGEDIRCRCIADPDFSTVSFLPIPGSRWEPISEERFTGTKAA